MAAATRIVAVIHLDDGTHVSAVLGPDPSRRPPLVEGSLQLEDPERDPTWLPFDPAPVGTSGVVELWARGRLESFAHPTPQELIENESLASAAYCRDLLARYARHVEACEGVAFTDYDVTREGDGHITEAEAELIREISGVFR